MRVIGRLLRAFCAILGVPLTWELSTQQMFTSVFLSFLMPTGRVILMSSAPPIFLSFGSGPVYLLVFQEATAGETLFH